MCNMDKINELTKSKMTVWKNAYGYAPDSAAYKLDKAMLSWIIDI